MVLSSIQEMIEGLRASLKSDPDGFLIGDLPAGNPKVEILPGPLGEHLAFLRMCDGARCGVIDLWPLEHIPGQQYRIENFPGAVEWLSVGQVLYEPLVLNRISGKVKLLTYGFPPVIDGPEYGSFNDFLQESVFGSGYLSLALNDQNDDWALLLKAHGYLRPAP